MYHPLRSPHAQISIHRSIIFILRHNLNLKCTRFINMVFVVLITGVSRGTYIRDPFPFPSVFLIVNLPYTRTRLRQLLNACLGIGKGFAEAYLSRPDHLVIGSIRESAASSPQVKELISFPAAEGSKLMLVNIESTSPTDAAVALQKVKNDGVEHLDLVIANAGGTPLPTTPLESVDAQEMTFVCQVNAVGPLMLFQACRPLLQKAQSPKWVSISTRGGSITLMGTIRSWDSSAYGAAKASLNWITR
jgi:hypothetical protein